MYADDFTCFWGKMMNETQNSAQAEHVPAACRRTGNMKAKLRDWCRIQPHKQTFLMM